MLPCNRFFGAEAHNMLRAIVSTTCYYWTYKQRESLVFSSKFWFSNFFSFYSISLIVQSSIFIHKNNIKHKKYVVYYFNSQAIQQLWKLKIVTYISINTWNMTGIYFISRSCFVRSRIVFVVVEVSKKRRHEKFAIAWEKNRDTRCFSLDFRVRVNDLRGRLNMQGYNISRIC